MIKPIEKIAICTALIHFYESDNENKFVFGMCAKVKKLVEMQCKESGHYYKGLWLDFPEFCRHEKYGQPVLWWAPFDFKSRIAYLNETINIIKSSLDFRIMKVNVLLQQASNDKNFLKVSQAKKLLTELNQQRNELPNH
jgi:hypothetical protein